MSLLLCAAVRLADHADLRRFRCELMRAVNRRATRGRTIGRIPHAVNAGRMACQSEIEMSPVGWPRRSDGRILGSHKGGVVKHSRITIPLLALILAVVTLSAQREGGPPAPSP